MVAILSWNSSAFQIAVFAAQLSQCTLTVLTVDSEEELMIFQLCMQLLTEHFTAHLLKLLVLLYHFCMNES